MADKIEKIIADTFLQMAEGLETGNFGKKPRIALTGMGSEHGEENAMEAAKMAAKDGIDVYYIGTLEADGITTVKVADDEEGHKKMEELLASHEIDGAVTMHFPFPIGVSTYALENVDFSKSLSGLKVLLVEDNELNMEIAKFILENAELESITMRKEVRD